jgi:hypothetical protein
MRLARALVNEGRRQNLRALMVDEAISTAPT